MYQGSTSTVVEFLVDALRSCRDLVEPRQREVVDRLLDESRSADRAINPADFVVDCLAQRFLVHQLLNKHATELKHQKPSPHHPQSRDRVGEDSVELLTVTTGAKTALSAEHSPVLQRVGRGLLKEWEVLCALQSRQLLQMSFQERYEMLWIMLAGGLIVGDMFYQCSSNLSFAAFLVLGVTISLQASLCHVVKSYYLATKLFMLEVPSGHVRPWRFVVQLLGHHSFFGLFLCATLGLTLGWGLASPTSAALFDASDVGFNAAWAQLFKTLLLQGLAIQTFWIIFALVAVVSVIHSIALSDAGQIASCFVGLALMVSGFINSPAQLPSWAAGVGNINPVHWAFLGLLKTNLPTTAVCNSRILQLNDPSTSASAPSGGWQSLPECIAQQVDDSNTGWLALTYFAALDVNEYAVMALMLLMYFAWLLLFYLTLVRLSRLIMAQHRQPAHPTVEDSPNQQKPPMQAVEIDDFSAVTRAPMSIEAPLQRAASDGPFDRSSISSPISPLSPPYHLRAISADEPTPSPSQKHMPRTSSEPISVQRSS